MKFLFTLILLFAFLPVRAEEAVPLTEQVRAAYAAELEKPEYHRASSVERAPDWSERFQEWLDSFFRSKRDWNDWQRAGQFSQFLLVILLLGVLIMLFRTLTRSGFSIKLSRPSRSSLPSAQDSVVLAELATVPGDWLGTLRAGWKQLESDLRQRGHGVGPGDTPRKVAQTGASISSNPETWWNLMRSVEKHVYAEMPTTEQDWKDFSLHLDSARQSLKLSAP
jgi:hypothetical protein